MYTLFINITNYINGYNADIIEILSVLAIISGIFVIIAKNPILSVLYLIILFLLIAVYLMFIGINFIGLSYILVYIGAVSILFLFILMLINIRISELQANTNNSIALSFIVGIFFYISLYITLPFNISKIYNNDFFYNITNINSMETYYVTSNFWDKSLIQSSHIITIGNTIYTNYFLWLIITSVILLLAMVGSIIITVKR